LGTARQVWTSEPGSAISLWLSETPDFAGLPGRLPVSVGVVGARDEPALRRGRAEGWSRNGRDSCSVLHLSWWLV